ncbi:hypothetical protein FPHYL_6987 [Fusarium phyllophilum]|uniref:Chromo domain-containing protein n=1 Tax=Fusarium phyllophilum TaxID=47803 RepID=A0A8H5NCH8_9HYPO|nr:hypothetical protein FPHYL_6987 [Fusarium phyllophilum]
MAANQDDQEYEIERFVRHRVNRRKKTVHFLVKWKGYNEQTWEPEALLQETASRMVYRYWRERGGRDPATYLRHYHVFKILARVWKKGQWHCHCQWVGYSDLRKDTTLETEKKVKRIAKDVLDEFKASQAAGNQNIPAANP